LNAGEELKVITRLFTKLWIRIQKCTSTSACWKNIKALSKTMCNFTKFCWRWKMKN